VADFYAARDNTMPPLPWSSIAPPFTVTGCCDPEPKLTAHCNRLSVPF
jgi:hypothetical protein